MGNIEKNKLILSVSAFLDCSYETAELYYRILKEPCTGNNLQEMDAEYKEKVGFLLDNCLVGVYDDEREKKESIYFAVDPWYSLNALLTRKIWERDSKLHSTKLLNDEPYTHDLYQEKLLVDEISDALTEVYNRQLPYASEVVIVVKNRKNVSGSITEHIIKANESIYAMVSPEQLMGEIVWNAVSERMKCGVRYVRITEFSEIVRHGLKIAQYEIENTSEKIYIYTSGLLPEKFYVIDEQTTIFFMKSRDRKRYLNRVQIVKNRGVAEKFIDQFNDLMRNCVDMEVLLPQVAEFENVFLYQKCAGLDRNTIEWLKDIFENGVFYSKNKYGEQFINECISKCLSMDLIKILPGDLTVVNYDIYDVLRDMEDDRDEC